MNDCPRQNPAYRPTPFFVVLGGNVLLLHEIIPPSTPFIQEVLHKVLHKRYIFRRGAVFYFRWRVPDTLRPYLRLTELTRSLQTDSYRCAYGRAAMFYRIVHELQEEQESLSLGLCSNQQFETAVSRFLNTLSTVIAKHSLDSHVNPSFSSISLQKVRYLGESPRLVDVFQSFIEYKRASGLSDRMVKEYGFYFEVCAAVFENKPITSITRKDIKNVLQCYAGLPRRNLRAYKKLSVDVLLKMNVPRDHLVAGKTVEQVKKMLHSLFVYAIDELNVLAETPVRNLNLKLNVSKTYAAYTDLEINKLLIASKSFKKSWQKWILLLGIYTGARRGELVKLHSDDVKLDEDSGRYYIMITDERGSVKTECSIRQVPLHRDILSAGFIEFIESKNGILFPCLKPQQVTGWFSRLRKALKIEYYDDFGNRKVFHSLRHTLITKARAAGVDVVKVQQVVGHERVGVSITDRYTHTFLLNDVLKVIDVI